MPAAACRDVYDALWNAGVAHGIADYGNFAMNAMRVEKASKGVGELTNEFTLLEADVLRFTRRDKTFLGSDRTFDADPPWICAYLEIEPNGVADGHGGEVVLRDGREVRATASVAFGPTVGKIMTFAYVEPEAAIAGTSL